MYLSDGIHLARLSLVNVLEWIGWLVKSIGKDGDAAGVRRRGKAGPEKPHALDIFCA